jgi:hypothetical protein
MAFDVEAAKADGYTDQEIQAYLASQGTPTPAQAASAAGEPVPQYQPVDRSAEYAGMAQGMGTALLPAVATGLATGAAGYGAYQGLKYAAPRAMDAVRNMGSANAPGGANNPIGGTRVPISTPTTTATAVSTTQAPQMQAAKSIVQKLALDKVMQGAGAVAKMAGPATGMAMNLFGTSPEEIAILKAAEARRRAQGQ